MSGQVQNANSATPATLTVGSDNTTTTFSGQLADGGTVPLGLTKTGTGKLTLTKISNYSGITTINHGTLQLGTSNGSEANSTPRHPSRSIAAAHWP